MTAASLMEGSPLRKAGLAMIAVTIAARGFGYIREAVVAAVFGTSDAVDLFLIAFTVPAILVTTVYYAIPNAFVPLWVHSSVRPRRLWSTVVLVGFVFLIVTLAISAFAGSVVSFVATGYPPGLRQEAAGLIQIGSWAILFAAIESLARSRLLSERRFVLPGLAYVWQSTAIISACVGWHAQGALALIWGYTIGTALAAAHSVLLFFLRRPKTAPPSEPADATASGQAWVWIASVVAIDLVGQMFAVVDRQLGSSLPEGAIAALNYAAMVSSVPHAILGLALSAAILPFLSHAQATGDEAQLSHIFRRTIRWALVLTVPLAVIGAVFSSDVIAVLYQRGAFDLASRELTGGALLALSFGIVPGIVAAIATRVHYATHRWKPVLLGSLAALSIKYASGALLITEFRAVGLAAATSIASWAWAIGIMVPLWSAVRKEISGWLALCVRLIVLCLVPCAIVRYATKGTVSDPIWSVLPLFAAAFATAVILLALGPRWGIGELGLLRAELGRQVARITRQGGRPDSR